MTEDEAKTKWCPHIRIGGHEVASNRDSDGAFLSVHDCIASKCMAWRWGRELDPNRYMPGEAAKRRPGYCGLAGPVS